MNLRTRGTALAALWMGVGGMLVWRGLPYTGLLGRSGVPVLGVKQRGIALAIAALVGLVKGLTILSRAFRKNMNRMADRGEQAPFWTLLDLRMLALIAAMVGAGLAVRLLPYDPETKAWVVSIVYPGIGLALFVAGLRGLGAVSKLGGGSTGDTAPTG